MSTDAEAKPLVEDAEAVLKQRLCGRVRELRVLVRAEGVVLRGASANYYGKQLAQHLAHQLFRLPIFANEIEVHAISNLPADDGCGPE